MQIVIDIEDLVYHQIKQHGEVSEFHKLIIRGTPLPKGHGRLIDADALDMKRIDYIVDGYANDKDDCTEFGMMIILAPTLVEADGGDAE